MCLDSRDLTGLPQGGPHSPMGPCMAYGIGTSHGSLCGDLMGLPYVGTSQSSLCKDREDLPVRYEPHRALLCSDLAGFYVQGTSQDIAGLPV